MSKGLSVTQQNYEVYDRELLVIMLALEDFWKYLVNSKEPFEIYTNHANLQYFKKPQKLNRHQAHWLTKLQDYHFTLHHIAGKLNSKADLLSCRPGYDQGENDNEDLTLLDPIIFHVLYTAYDLSNNIYGLHILKAKANLEESIQKAVTRKEDGWEESSNGTLMYCNCAYVPID
jgi:hypothetical protein